MRRLLLAATFLLAASVSAQPRPPLTRALADALYAKLAGGSSVAGTTTFANITVSGTCTGCTAGAVPTTRLISTTSPLGGGGDLSADRTLTCTTCATSSNNLSFFSATSSAQLAALLNDETGSGPAVFATSPTLVTPTIGEAAATTINGNTFTTGTYTLTGAAAKTLTFSNTLTLAGTDSTTMMFPSTSATIARTDAANTFTGHQTIEGVTSTGATGTGKFVFDGSPTIVTPTIASFTNATHNHQNAAGGGTLVDAAITFTAPALGAPTATTIQTSGNTGLGVAPSAVNGVRLTVEQNGNQITKVVSHNTDAASTGSAASFVAQASTAVVQATAFGDAFSGTFFGLNLAGQSSVNNGGVGSVGFTIGTSNSVPVVMGTNGTRALTISASSQAVSLRGTQTNDNATAGDAGEFTNAQCPGPTTTATITVTIASPGVVTWSSHPFNGTAPRFDACPVVFTTGGALPTGITASTTYWVVPTTISGNNFSIATSVANAIAGTAINTSGSQSGTHTGTAGSVLTTATAKDVTGLALTAGNWDCSALLARGLGGTTSVTLLKTSISTTSATDGTVPAGTMNQFAQAASVPANDVDESIGPIDLRNSGTTNTFLVADDTFTLSTNKAYGTIRCRRMR